jgi:hypothetical protein
MTQEQLRMQMLAGVITESEYKAKLNEIDNSEYNKFMKVFQFIESNGTSTQNDGWELNGTTAFLTDGGMIRVIKNSNLSVEMLYDNSLKYHKGDSTDLDDILDQI